MKTEKISFKTIAKIWAITATSALVINLVWFFIQTGKEGNLWSDIIGPIPIMVMSLATILAATLVYWQVVSRFKLPNAIYSIGCISLGILSVLGQPTLSNGSLVPLEFRILDIPMHFTCAFCAAFLVPLLSIYFEELGKRVNK